MTQVECGGCAWLLVTMELHGLHSGHGGRSATHKPPSLAPTALTPFSSCPSVMWSIPLLPSIHLSSFHLPFPSSISSVHPCIPVSHSYVHSAFLTSLPPFCVFSSVHTSSLLSGLFFPPCLGPSLSCFFFQHFLLSLDPFLIPSIFLSIHLSFLLFLELSFLLCVISSVCPLVCPSFHP